VTSPASSAFPSPRYDVYSCNNGVDTIYIFGGRDQYYLDEVWSYNITSKLWSFLYGNTATAQGISPVYYVTQSPGTRSGGGMVYLSNQQLLIFSGTLFSEGGAYSYADVWLYSLKKGLWTFVGDEATVIVTLQNASGYPTARRGFGMTTMNNGTVVVFGGYGGSDPPAFYYNDLWFYNPKTNIWNLMFGNPRETQQNFAVYSNPTPYPGGRYGHSVNVLYDNTIIIIGGFGYTANNSGYLDDIWRYNPKTSSWSFIYSSETSNSSGSLFLHSAITFNLFDTLVFGGAQGQSTSNVMLLLTVNNCSGLNNCSFRGGCSADFVCTCEPGNLLADCSEFTCISLSNCSNNGNCSGPDTCDCYDLGPNIDENDCSLNLSYTTGVTGVTGTTSGGIFSSLIINMLFLLIVLLIK